MVQRLLAYQSASDWLHLGANGDSALMRCADAPTEIADEESLVLTAKVHCTAFSVFSAFAACAQMHETAIVEMSHGVCVCVGRLCWRLWAATQRDCSPDCRTWPVTRLWLLLSDVGGLRWCPSY